MPQVKVLFFASLKEQAGTHEVIINLPENVNVEELKHLLAGMFPKIAPGMPTALVAVNHEFAFEADPIPAEAEIAVFPPVSGGSALPTIITSRKMFWI
jgi:molybdopterin synthase catalytic subunit